MDHLFKSRYAASSFSSSDNLWNEPILTTEHFVVLPSIGAIVEGWLLIAPRDPVLSIGALGGIWDDELSELKKYLVSVLTRQYGPVSVFEHGPAQIGSVVGCGVDHAHLHLVPTRIDLLAYARKLSPKTVWTPCRNPNQLVDAHRDGFSYLYLEQPLYCPESVISVGSSILSQFFRRIIAEGAGKAEQWDWKQYPFMDNVHATRCCLERVINHTLSLA